METLQLIQKEMLIQFQNTNHLDFLIIVLMKDYIIAEVNQKMF